MKRTRLAGQQHPKFQRYVLPALAEDEPAPAPLLGPTIIRNPPSPPPPKPRILPDLSTGKAWVEDPVLPQSDAIEPVAVCPTSDEAVVEALSLQDAEAVSGVSESEGALPEVPHKRPTRRKLLKGTAEDLPRGQRWKRRLPRTAW